MSDALETPHDAQSKREDAMAKSLVKQGERLAAERDAEKAKADEQRHLADLGWAKVDEMKAELETARTSNAAVRKALLAEIETLKAKGLLYDAAIAERDTLRTQLDELLAALRALPTTKPIPAWSSADDCVKWIAKELEELRDDAADANRSARDSADDAQRWEDDFDDMKRERDDIEEQLTDATALLSECVAGPVYVDMVMADKIRAFLEAK